MTMRRRIVVVTGAGLGLGRALATEFIRRGHRVAGIGRSSADLEATAAVSGPDHFTGYVCDVADAAAVRDTIARIEREIGPVDILVNNAAIYDRFDFLDGGPERFMASVAVNLGGMVNCCHAVLDGMTARGEGRIVNVSTFADLSPLSGSAAYSVSKGAARIFTRALVADIADRFPGIVVNDWIPGALATRMGLADGIAPDVAARWGVTLAEAQDRTLSGTLFDRDREVLPHRSIRRRIRDFALMQSAPKARLLSGETLAMAAAGA